MSRCICARVAYWPPTRPSCQNRKCTGINNRCIRPRNSGYNLDRGRVEWVQFVTPTRRWVSNNYITRVKTGSHLLEFSQLEIRCGRENQHPAEGAIRTPDWSVGDQTSWREDAGMRNMSHRGWASRPPVEQLRRTGKKRCYAHKTGGQYAAVLFGLQLPLTVKPLLTLWTLSNKVRGIFF